MQNSLETYYSKFAYWGLFAVFTGLYVIFDQFTATKIFAEYWSYSFIFCLEIVLVTLSFSLYRKATAKTKRIFEFFAFSLSFYIIFTVIYIIFFEILNLSHSELSHLTLLVYNLPLLGFLFFQMLIWFYMLPRGTSNLKKPQSLYIKTPILIITVNMLFLFFMIFKHGMWYDQSFAFRLYLVVSAGFEFIAFILVILCLATTNNKNVLLLAIGYLVLRGSSLVMTFNILTQKYDANSLLRFFIMLGMGIMTYSLIGFRKTGDYKTLPKTWLYPMNSLRSQIAFWIFAIIVLTASLLWGGYYLIAPKIFFSRELLQELLFMLTFYILISIIVSKIFAEKICNPLKNMESSMRSFMSDAKPAIATMEKNQNLIEELKEHEQFLVHVFKTLEDKHAAEKYISKMAAQVAHDIGSPLMAMQFALKKIEGLDGKSKATIHNVAGRINDLANYLLTEYKNPKIGKQSELSTEFMPDLIDSIIFEKKFLQEGKKVKFHFNIADDAYTSFIKTDKVEFQRALSNLLNNSIEAINSKGEVTINLKNEGDKALIEVIDTGAGIPQELINKITEERFTYGKAQGTGLGLSYAIDRIKAWGGDYRITSKIGAGTTITITLPKADYPAWFQEQLSVPAGGNIVVLDSGEEIYAELAKRFDNVIHCQTVQELESLASQSGNNCYLIGTVLAGICPEQLIKDLNIQQNAYLVTDKHSDKILMGICQSNGIKAIPRSYIGQIPISP